MAKHLETGKLGEDQAKSLLLAKSYQILEQNWRYGRYEIDIIARWNDLLVFVEVKTRKNNRFGFPEDFVEDAQRQRIVEAAEHYLESIKWKGDVRFDLISITLQGPDAGIYHIEDAFFPFN